MKKIARICDMREGNKMELLQEDDGDIIVSIMPEKDVVTRRCVQFCLSGTQSHRTTLALHELFKAMEADESSIPQKQLMAH